MRRLSIPNQVAEDRNADTGNYPGPLPTTDATRDQPNSISPAATTPERTESLISRCDSDPIPGCRDGRQADSDEDDY